MSFIFNDITFTDTDDNEHTCRVCVDEYIPPLPATQWEPEQHEAVEWTFCDERAGLSCHRLRLATAKIGASKSC